VTVIHRVDDEPADIDADLRESLREGRPLRRDLAPVRPDVEVR
jgi:hypothetical protein